VRSTTGKWVRRAVVVGVAAVVIDRLLGPDRQPRLTRSEPAPAIGGDTWPPVPLNPDWED
jgi:hypothetical protein